VAFRLRQRRPHQDRRPRPNSNNAGWNGVVIVHWAVNSGPNQCEIIFNQPGTAPSEGNPYLNLVIEDRRNLAIALANPATAGNASIDIVPGPALQEGDIVTFDGSQELLMVTAVNGGGNFDVSRGQCGTVATSHLAGATGHTTDGETVLQLFAQTQPATFQWDMSADALLMAGQVCYLIDSTGIYFNGPEIQRGQRIALVNN
jgi:hypothetical protein